MFDAVFLLHMSPTTGPRTRIYGEFFKIRRYELTCRGLNLGFVGFRAVFKTEPQTHGPSQAPSLGILEAILTNSLHCSSFVGLVTF